MDEAVSNGIADKYVSQGNGAAGLALWSLHAVRSSIEASLMQLYRQRVFV